MSPLSEVHRSRLALKYGVDVEDSVVKGLVESGLLRSIRSTEELQTILMRNDVVGTGIYIGYLNDSGTFTIRLDEPLQKDGKEVKYLRRSGELNHLFVPPGLDLANTNNLIITEGELKSLSGYLRGLPVASLSGIWNWRTHGAESELFDNGEKLKDSESLIPELNRDLKGKYVTLLYDSDITSTHPGYPASERLAEQLYRLGAEEVKIVTLPSLNDRSKTGLDDFLLAKGATGPADLNRIIERAEPYFPLNDGAETYAERLIRHENPEEKLKAAIAYLAYKGEFITADWLKNHILKAGDRKTLIRNAKSRLKDIWRKREAKRVSSGKESILNPIYKAPISLLQGSEYTINDRGHLCKMEIRIAEGIDGFVPKPLCNFVPIPLRQVLKDDGLEVERYIEVEAISPNEKKFGPTMVSMASFESMKWVGTEWGAQAAMEAGPIVKDEVRHCIQSMATNGCIPEETVYAHLGWRKIEGSWVYLHAGGAIGSKVRVEPHKRLIRYVLPDKVENLMEALKSSLELLYVAPLEITIPLISLVYLSPLCEALRSVGIEPGFLIWLYGPTGSMKSTIVALFLSHFGMFDSKSLPASFRDTSASLESATFAAKDSLIVIDDFYPPHNYREKEKLESLAQQLTRAFGDRTGRGRMTSSLKERVNHPPRGMALVTGEELPSGESTTARNFTLEMIPCSVNKDKLGKAQSLRPMLGQAMRGYLEYLSPQLDSLAKELHDEFVNIRNRAQKENRHPRLPEAVALLYLGFNCFLDFCVSEGAISKEEAEKLAMEAWKILNLIVERQSELIGDQRPLLKFFNILQELLLQRRVYLASLKNEVPPDSEHLTPEKRIGWKGDGTVYLSMEVAYTEVYQYCRDQGEIFSIQKQTLIKHIGHYGYLVEKPEKGNVIQKRFAEERVRVLVVKAELLGVE